MIVSVAVSDVVIREAQNHGLTVEEYVESLIDQGREEARAGRPVVSSAIERIRALRTTATGKEP